MQNSSLPLERAPANRDTVKPPAPALRPMVDQDLDAVCLLAARSSGAPQWTRAHYEKALAQDLNLEPELDPNLERFATVAYSGDTLAGFGLGSRVRGEDCADLESIVVDVGFRRAGIGSAVLRSVMDAAAHSGARAMQLEVRPSNQEALALYWKNGFKEIGRRPGYYSEPREDALLLKVLLTSGATD